jgi:hypothetical protein
MQYNTTLDNNTATNIVFDGTDVYDTDGFHSPSVNNTQIIIPEGKAGKYLIVFNGSMAADTTGRRRYLLMLNGSTGRAGVDFAGGGDTSEGTQYQTFSVVRNLNVADYIEIRAFQNSGSGRSMYADDVRFQLTYLGA